MKRYWVLALLLALLGCAKPVPAPEPGSNSVDTLTTPTKKVTAGLTIEEYPLTTDEFLGQMGSEYLKLLPTLRAQREPWRSPSPQMSVKLNQQLKGTGYSVTYATRNNTRVFDLYKDNQPIVTDLTGPIAISRSASGKRFLLTVGPIAVADENGLVPQLPPERLAASGLLYQAPVMVGEDVVSIRWDQPTQSIQVLRNGKLDYSSPFGHTLASYHYAAQGLSAWDGNWVLETWDDQVLVDGQSLNQQLGYEKIFAFRMLAGAPFYFFTRNSKVHASYGGDLLAVEYDQVAHHGCCDSTWVNPVGSDAMISFFGRRNGTWYYVDFGTYD